jgi:ShK domain-like
MAVVRLPSLLQTTFWFLVLATHVIGAAEETTAHDAHQSVEETASVAPVPSNVWSSNHDNTTAPEVNKTSEGETLVGIDADGNTIALSSPGSTSADLSSEDEANVEEDEHDLEYDDFGVVQDIENFIFEEKIKERIAEAEKYVTERVWNNEWVNEKVGEMCQNKHPSCAKWAVLGECESNPEYMNSDCAPVCFTCEQLHAETRCPVDPTVPDALYPGDIDKLFTRLTTDPAWEDLAITIHSRPAYVNGDTAENATYKIGPWIITIDDAIEGVWADRLVELGAAEGYERSEDVGEELPDGTYGSETNDDRTSTNACTYVDLSFLFLLCLSQNSECILQGAATLVSRIQWLNWS